MYCVLRIDRCTMCVEDKEEPCSSWRLEKRMLVMTEMSAPRELHRCKEQQQQRLQIKKQEISKPKNLPLRTYIMALGATSGQLGGIGWGCV